MFSRRLPLALAMLVAGFTVPLSGCRTLAPEVINSDRVNFSEVVSTSWQKQLLLNIVKLRYFDSPMFMDVSQIVSGYNIETTISLGLNPYDANGTLSLGGSGKYIDRPTISYTPLAGNKFYKQLMLPVQPSAILFLLDAGWPVDLILPLSVEAINGIRSGNRFGASASSGNPEYAELTGLLKRLLESHAIGMHLLRKNGGDATVLFFRSGGLNEAALADISRVRELLRLNADRQEFQVSYGAANAGGENIMLYTRSILAMLLELASRVDVPDADIAEGRAAPVLKPDRAGRESLLHVHCSDTQPSQAHVAVPYRGRWYWIDDRDLISKRTFAFLMVLFSLAETEGPVNLPVLTIPAG